MCDCARACVCVSDSFRPPVKQNPTLDCFHLCVLPIQVCVVNQLSGAGSATVLRSREGDEVDVGRVGVGGGWSRTPLATAPAEWREQKDA